MNRCEDILEHHGILGMKWGVRRFQNKDGSLTAAGRKRYGVGEKMDTDIKGDSAVTKRVKKAYNEMSDSDFKNKYGITKEKYRKRVNKYGDPYKKSPAAKIGRALEKDKRRTSEKLSKMRKENAETIGKNSKKSASKYNPDNKKQKEYYEKFIKKGISEDMAKAMAYDKYKTNNILKAAAVTTVAAVGAYELYKYKKYVSDIVIKKDALIGRVGDGTEIDANGKLLHNIYATFNPKDKIRYYHVYSPQKINPKWTNFRPSEEFKVAGHKTGRKLMNELLQSSPEAKTSARQMAEVLNQFGHRESQRNAAREAIKLLDAGKPLNRKAYEGLNVAMTMSEKNAYKFNDLLGKHAATKGFFGLQDINDQKYSSLISKTPTIFFKDAPISAVRTKDIDTTNDAFQKILNSERMKLILHNTARAEKKNPVNYLYGAAGATAVSKSVDRRANKIADFRRRNPNTKKTDEEILAYLRYSK